jgi:hypothetical protein
MIYIRYLRIYMIGGIVALTFSMIYQQAAWAHCDSLDGPVVTDARAALEAEDVTKVLKWIPEKDEQEVKKAFEQALIVREHGAEAQEFAERYFFETLVRLHREYEGAVFTGLKPAGEDVHPAIARADASLEKGKVDALARDIAGAVESSIRSQFDDTLKAKSRQGKSVKAGREFVDQYVQFVHYVKYLHDAATGEHDHGHRTTGD